MGAGEFPEYVQTGWWLDGQEENVEIVPTGARGQRVHGRCVECEGVTDWRWIEPTVRVRHRNHDVLSTTDCRVLVSMRARELPPDGDECFVPLPADPDFALVSPTQIVERDPPEMALMHSDASATCGRLQNVSAPHGIVLKTAPPAGLSRTDVEFGPGWIKAPRICIGLELAETLRSAGLRGLRLQPVHTETRNLSR